MKTLLKNQRWVATLAGSAAVLVFLLAAGAPRALADSISYNLTMPNSGLSGYTGPYAAVGVDLTSAITATITFNSLTNGGYIYLMGDGGTADLNVNGSYDLGPVTESNSISGFGASYKDNSPGNVDGFGTFSLSLNNNGGFTDTATTISFTLTDTSGTWSSASDVLLANADGALAAVHAYACADPGCSTASGAATTGFAANLGATEVSEPATAMLLGVGLLALVALDAYRRRKLAV